MGDIAVITTLEGAIDEFEVLKDVDCIEATPEVDELTEEELNVLDGSALLRVIEPNRLELGVADVKF